MNVKQGDLARIVAPFHPNGVGRWVDVIRCAADIEIFQVGGERVRFHSPTPSWVCKGRVPLFDGFVCDGLVVIADACLRPLNPGDAPGADGVARPIEEVAA